MNMRRRFGIKGKVVVDLMKHTEYPILGYRQFPYFIYFLGRGPDFKIITKKQVFLRSGLWVW